MRSNECIVSARLRQKWNWKTNVYFCKFPMWSTRMEWAHFGNDMVQGGDFSSFFICRCIWDRFVVTGAGDIWKSNRSNNSLNNISNVTQRIDAFEQVFEYILHFFFFSFDWEKMYLCVAISTWKVLHRFFFFCILHTSENDEAELPSSCVLYQRKFTRFFLSHSLHSFRCCVQFYK